MSSDTAIHLFFLGFLKIAALLFAFFFLDRERNLNPNQSALRRLLHWPVALTLLVACGAEGYDAYLKYADDRESNKKTEKLLQSIERSSRPLFPLNIQGQYSMDISGKEFDPLRSIRGELVEYEDVLPVNVLKGAAAKVLRWDVAKIFDSHIETVLFFLRQSESDLALQNFVSPSFLRGKVELSIRIATPTSCGEWNALITPNCEWKAEKLLIPILDSTVDAHSTPDVYMHGGIQYVQDLANSLVVVQSCINVPVEKSSNASAYIGTLKRASVPLDITDLTVTVAGGDTLRLHKPDEQLVHEGCSFAKFVLPATPEKLDELLGR